MIYNPKLIVPSNWAIGVGNTVVPPKLVLISGIEIRITYRCFRENRECRTKRSRRDRKHWRNRWARQPCGSEARVVKPALLVRTSQLPNYEGSTCSIRLHLLYARKIMDMDSVWAVFQVQEEDASAPLLTAKRASLRFAEQLGEHGAGCGRGDTGEN